MNAYVSRGGLKLEQALRNFKVNVKDKIVLDVGSSTGGFVDCLLQNGASKVFALDTAYGELAWKLRNDSKVVVMERTNILHLEGFNEKVDLVTIDAGWTKLGLILPKIKGLLKEGGEIIALVKPHYEAEKRDLVKGILNEEKALEVKDMVKKQIEELGFRVEKEVESPILGGGGNKEYLLLIL